MCGCEPPASPRRGDAPGCVREDQAAGVARPAWQRAASRGWPAWVKSWAAPSSSAAAWSWLPSDRARWARASRIAPCRGALHSRDERSATARPVVVDVADVGAGDRGGDGEHDVAEGAGVLEAHDLGCLVDDGSGGLRVGSGQDHRAEDALHKCEAMIDQRARAGPAAAAGSPRPGQPEAAGEPLQELPPHPTHRSPGAGRRRPAAHARHRRRRRRAGLPRRAARLRRPPSQYSGTSGGLTQRRSQRLDLGIWRRPVEGIRQRTGTGRTRCLPTPGCRARAATPAVGGEQLAPVVRDQRLQRE